MIKRWIQRLQDGPRKKAAVEAKSESESEAKMEWLIVGLGNPGAKYEHTRHNAGRDAVLALAAAHGVKLDRLKHNSRHGVVTLGAHRALLAVPTTYMNESGRAVGPLADFYRIAPERILVVYDEVDLPLGRLRLKREGGPGGHNGMKSIIRALGTQEFPRLRLGVGRPLDGWDTADHVLSRFRDEEQADAEALVRSAVDAIELVVRDGVQSAMNVVNVAAER